MVTVGLAGMAWLACGLVVLWLSEVKPVGDISQFVKNLIYSEEVYLRTWVSHIKSRCRSRVEQDDEMCQDDTHQLTSEG